MTSGIVLSFGSYAQLKSEGSACLDVVAQALSKTFVNQLRLNEQIPIYIINDCPFFVEGTVP